MGAPHRLTWAVELLDIQPADHLLEIGCGQGVAVDLICRRLQTGRLVAIDRSAKMIDAADRRNAEHIASAKAELRLLALEDADFADGCFDKVLAVNINLFWTRDPVAEIALLKRILKATAR